MIKLKSVEQTDRDVQEGDAATILGVHYARAARDDLINNLRLLSPYTVQLPDANADDSYERVSEAERDLVAPKLNVEDYCHGRAEIPDDIRTLFGRAGLLFSADHATDPVRRNAVHEGADHGTAGLVGVLWSEDHGTAVVPIGRQTGNANADLGHPLKEELVRHTGGARGFLSVHGMMPGKFTHQHDMAEVHGVLGLGKAYDPKTYYVATEAVRQIQDETGLRIVIGNENRLYRPDALPELMRDGDGAIKYSQLAALGEGSTTNYFRSLAPSVPAMQIELSRSIRFLPEGMEYRDPKAARMGVHMGLVVVRRLSEIMMSIYDEEADSRTV